MRRLFVPLVGVAAALALVTPAEAGDNGSAGATTTSIKVADTAKVVTATTIVSGPDTTPKPATDASDDDNDSDRTGLWGLLGLLGLAGLAGLKRKRDDRTTVSTTRPVTGTAPPRADGATGSR